MLEKRAMIGTRFQNARKNARKIVGVVQEPCGNALLVEPYLAAMSGITQAKPTRSASTAKPRP